MQMIFWANLQPIRGIVFYHHCYYKYNFITNCGMVPKMVWLNCNWTVMGFFNIMIYIKRNIITNCDLVPVMALVDLWFFFLFVKVLQPLIVPHRSPPLQSPHSISQQAWPLTTVL